MTDDRDYAMIGANILITTPSVYINRLLSLFCEQARRNPTMLPPGVAIAGPIKTCIEWSALPTFDSHH
jgi:hypothetical protein